LKNVEMKVLTGYHSYNSKKSCWYNSVKKHGGAGINALPVTAAQCLDVTAVLKSMEVKVSMLYHSYSSSI
jgi:hypothetical protein